MTQAIVVERRIAAPPHVVYAYLTQSDKWARWQGVAAAIEAVPGGAFSMTMANGTEAHGQVIDLVPNRRLVLTWGWVDHPGLPPGTSTVEINLEPDGDATMLRLAHHGLPPTEVDIHLAGWNRYLPRLAVAATGGDPGADLPS